MEKIYRDEVMFMADNMILGKFDMEETAYQIKKKIKKEL